MKRNKINETIDETEGKEGGIMVKIASFIVDKHRAFYFIFCN